MSVYLVEGTKASCRVSGCLCRDRGPRYPSDVTDAEWELLGPEAQAVMAELRRGPGGRPMEHDLRAVLDVPGDAGQSGLLTQVRLVLQQLSLTSQHNESDQL